MRLLSQHPGDAGYGIPNIRGKGRTVCTLSLIHI